MKTLFTAVCVLIATPAFSQVIVGGLMDLEFRMAGSDSKPYINQTPSTKPTIYFPNARLFVDAPISNEWSFLAVLQSDYYGSKSPHPLFISLAQVTWMPFESDFALHAGRIILPVGITSERFLSSENPLRHLPMNHEWGMRVDKKWGLIKGPRDYAVAPGLTFIYNRMYMHGIAAQGSVSDAVNYHIALATSAPSGFNEAGEYSVPAVMGRIAYQPLVWMRLGGSFGHGAYMRKDPLNDPVLSDADRQSLTQTLIGADITLDYRYARISYEFLQSDWKMVEIDRTVTPNTASNTWTYPAQSHMVEGKVDAPFQPGLYAAFRYDRISVRNYAYALGTLQRLEFGLGKKLNQSVTAKATYTKGWNEGPDLMDDVFGVQLSVGF